MSQREAFGRVVFAAILCSCSSASLHRESQSLPLTLGIQVNCPYGLAG